MRSLRLLLLVSTIVFLAGCGSNGSTSGIARVTTAPNVTSAPVAPTDANLANPGTPVLDSGGQSAARGPGYEPAYVGGKTVTINAIEVPNHAPGTAQADFYEVSYPIGWQDLGLAPPQCNPCDHDGNGIDPADFHDHILDSMPSTGHGEFTPLWHVWVIVPAYNGDSAHDTAVSLAYASHLPTKSEAAVNDLLAARDANGAPIAVQIDTHFYFLCAVVSPNAAK